MILSAWLLGWLIGSGVAAFIVNALWTIAWQRNRRIAQREHDSICGQISRDGRVEIERQKYLVQAHHDTIRGHKEQIADRDLTIENLQAIREKAAKRILSLEDSNREKCVELDAKNQEIKEIKQRCNEIKQRCSDAWRFFNLDESIITTPTFQPKRPEEQLQKPTCDN